MAGFNFLKNLVKGHANNALTALSDFLVNLDPETASQAELDTLSEHLTKASLEMAAQKKDWEKEQKEADDALALYRQRKAAADILAKTLDGMAEGDPKRAATEAALNKQLKVLEEMVPEVQREKREAEEALALFNEIKDFVEQSAEALKKAKQALESKQRELKASELEAQRAKDRAGRAEILAGIKQKSSALTSATDAMDRKIEKNRIQAGAANTRADLLGPKPPSEEDKLIADAMTQAAGGPAPAASREERRAALPDL